MSHKPSPMGGGHLFHAHPPVRFYLSVHQRGLCRTHTCCDLRFWICPNSFFFIKSICKQLLRNLRRDSLSDPPSPCYCGAIDYCVPLLCITFLVGRKRGPSCLIYNNLLLVYNNLGMLTWSQAVVHGTLYTESLAHVHV